jgi:hypothetical protein
MVSSGGFEQAGQAKHQYAFAKRQLQHGTYDLQHLACGSKHPEP